MNALLELTRERALLSKTQTPKYALEYIALLEEELRTIRREYDQKMSDAGWAETARLQARTGGTM